MAAEVGVRLSLAMVALAVLAACGGKSSPDQTSGPTATTTPTPMPTNDAPPTSSPGPTTPAPAPEAPPPVSTPEGPKPPILLEGGWSFYAQDQQLTPSIHDVSADEAGNVYAAAFDALFVKPRDAKAFTRVDGAAAGLSASCHDPRYIRVESPPDPLSVCPIISVAGLGPGRAIVGYKGVGTDSDADASWALLSGGADVVSYDGSAVKRERRVLVASPPGVVCETWLDPPTNSECSPGDYTWVTGRQKSRQINRIAVNRKAGIGFRDAVLGGSHGTFSILVANPGRRGWSAFDKTAEAAKKEPFWADATGVWEHEHADSTTAPDGTFRSGETWALAFDPRTGTPWGANEFQIASLPEYARMTRPTWNNWWGDVARQTIWSPERDPHGARDNVQSIAFCDDGTMWVASMGHGLARFSAGGGVSFLSVPGGDALASVACDPSDRSVWAGSAFDGGIWRVKDGTCRPCPPTRRRLRGRTRSAASRSTAGRPRASSTSRTPR